MANRISKVVTRTGDDGTTGMADGRRIAKSSVRIDCIGDIDELNSLLGLLQAQNMEQPVADVLTRVQNILFNLGGELSSPYKSFIGSETVNYLDERIEEFNSDLPPLKEFILPGGNQAASICHLARAVCRRCERHLFLLAETETVNHWTTTYINRLSDLLFVLARVLTKIDGGKEIYWDKHG